MTLILKSIIKTGRFHAFLDRNVEVAYLHGIFKGLSAKVIV